MSTNKTIFKYFATIKLSAPELKIQILQDIYPGINTLSCTSKPFSDYDDCVESCKSLMDDLLLKANISENSFKIGAEVNPLYSGNPTLSKDWESGEISRLWIYDKKMESTKQIHAVGQARIFSHQGDRPELILN